MILAAAVIMHELAQTAAAHNLIFYIFVLHGYTTFCLAACSLIEVAAENRSCPKSASSNQMSFVAVAESDVDPSTLSKAYKYFWYF